MAKADYWLTAEEAINSLKEAGYEAKLENGVSYRKPGVSGRLHVHTYGVDGYAIMRLLDRGS